MDKIYSILTVITYLVGLLCIIYLTNNPNITTPYIKEAYETIQQKVMRP